MSSPRLSLVLGILFLGILPLNAPAAPVRTEHVEAELVAERSAVTPGESLTVALRLRMIPHWHTYWRNPGDSGQKTEIAWTLPQGFKAGEIQLVYAHNDDMALGAVTALEAAGRQDGVKVVGIDGENAAYDAIKAGKMVATFTYHFVAPEGIQYGYKIAKGEKLDKEIVLQTHQVDASNVDQFLGKGF